MAEIDVIKLSRRIIVNTPVWLFRETNTTQIITETLYSRDSSHSISFSSQISTETLYSLNLTPTPSPTPTPTPTPTSSSLSTHSSQIIIETLSSLSLLSLSSQITIETLYSPNLTPTPTPTPTSSHFIPVTLDALNQFADMTGGMRGN